MMKTMKNIRKDDMEEGRKEQREKGMCQGRNDRRMKRRHYGCKGGKVNGSGRKKDDWDEECKKGMKEKRGESGEIKNKGGRRGKRKEKNGRREKQRGIED